MAVSKFKIYFFCNEMQKPTSPDAGTTKNGKTSLLQKGIAIQMQFSFISPKASALI